MLRLNSNTFATSLGIGSMAPGIQLCAIKLILLAREEPRLECRAPKPWRSWVAISIGVRGSGRHLPFSLFLAWGLLEFVLLYEGSWCLFSCMRAPGVCSLALRAEGSRGRALCVPHLGWPALLFRLCLQGDPSCAFHVGNTLVL